MTKKTYRDKNCDLDVLNKQIESWFSDQGYEVQGNKTAGSWYLQAQKTEGWRKAVGASRAFTILIEGQPNDFSVELGTGEWASNLVAGGVAAVLTGGVSIIGSGLATGWAKKIEGDIWKFIDEQIIFKAKVKSERELTLLKEQESMQDKLKQLQDAFDQGFIDEVAYQAKKQEIEHKAQDNLKNTELNEKLIKLKNALDSGILSSEEYENKKAELISQSSHAELDNKLSQIRAALASGILNQEEFDIKASQIQKEIAFAEKLKQLENAKNAGVITVEEFEKKKAALLS
ncbi:SHOCT domain-containing protein [Laspinema palackyanum]|uniref:SHOCT domain-containing protein n=1 Tax=Laspinema palackyanum TaxID=3231601 RepID=UPI00345CA737|nr:SHOCT domain-containing protein [Laspinema sp. D2c]